MKYVLALVALAAMFSFVTSAHAAGKPSKPKPGQFVSMDDKGITFKGGKKGKGKEVTVKFDDSTKFTIDGKDVTLADAQKQLKAEEYIEVTTQGKDADKVVVLVAASTTGAPATTAPAPK